MPANETKINQQLISYLLLRRCIGFLGISLPIILVAGAFFYGDCKLIQSSISDYYHTEMRNIFVGVLCAIALFMFTYVGNDYRDRIAGNLASIFALGIAFFPTYVDLDSGSCGTNCLDYEPWVSIMHFTFAALFFIVLIYFSLVLFTQSNYEKNERPEQKRKRDTLYRICGYIMIVCIVLIAIYAAFIKTKFPEIKKLDPVFWLESIALFAFGISWLTKGQFLFEDE